MIKKRKHWPKHVKGNYINKRFKDKQPGDAEMRRGELDGMKVDLYSIKEPDYVMMFISTYGILQRLGEQKNQVI